MCSLRIEAAAGPVGAASGVADVDRAEPAVRRRRESAARTASLVPVALQVLERFRAQLRREVDESSGTLTNARA